MEKRLRVAHFTNTYHPVISGVVRSVSTFRQALTELGHDVFILAQQASSDYKETEPYIFRYSAIDLPMLPDFPLTIPISPFVDKLLPPLKLHAIHTHHPFLLGRTGARQAKELGIPLVFTFHTRYREYSHYVALNQRLVKDMINRWVGEYMQKCHHIVVPSESMRQILAEEYGVTEQVTAVPTGIDLEPYRQATGQAIRQERGWGQDTVLISVGRMAKEKNWETLLAAVAQVMDNRPEVRLVLLGEGDDRVDLEDYAAELGMGQRVEFTGNVPFDQVPEYLSAADLFCFASLTETQGLVTMEAIAAGLPVVAVDASGTRDVITHDQAGLLTENDEQALAQALERVLADEALYQRLQTGAREQAETFEMTHQAQRLVDVYNQAQEDRQAQRFVSVDKQKQVFNLIDEEQWAKFLGLERKKSS